MLAMIIPQARHTLHAYQTRPGWSGHTSFPLDGDGGFAGGVVDDAIDAADLLEFLSFASPCNEKTAVVRYAEEAVEQRILRQNDVF